jgi:predicted GTPase
MIRSAVGLTMLARQARSLGLRDDAVHLDSTLQHLEEGSFSISVVGEFKRGKSTIINALLGSSTLPTDAMPATASITRVVYGRNPQAILVRRDGARESVGISDLPRHITKIDEAAAARASLIREAIVAYPTLLCQNNVEIVDTPGLSDEEAMTRLTLDVLPRTDAVIFVVMALSPFGQTEMAFLAELLTRIDIGRIFFVVTHIDKLRDPADAPRLVGAVASRIGQAVEAAVSAPVDAGALRIFPVSAWEALVAKEEHDSTRYHKSRFGELEQALERYLARDRGAATLSRVTQVIRDSALAQLAELQSQSQREAAQDAQDEACCQHHQHELDALFAQAEALAQGVIGRAELCTQAVREVAATGHQRLLRIAQETLQSFSFHDDLMADGEARTDLVRSHLKRALDPQLDDLSDKLSSLIAQWCSREDAALEEMNRRLNERLAKCQADSGDSGSADVPVRQKRDPQQGLAVALARQGLASLSALSVKFKEAFQPSAGFLTGPALGAVGWALGTETVQGTWRTVRGWMNKEGVSRAEAQLQESRDLIRERMRAGYIKETTQHINTLFTSLQFEENASSLVTSIIPGVASAVARERDYIGEIIAWRKVGLRIERARRHVAHTHRQAEFKEMEVETSALIHETERHSELLMRALLPDLT